MSDITNFPYTTCGDFFIRETERPHYLLIHDVSRAPQQIVLENVIGVEEDEDGNYNIITTDGEIGIVIKWEEE